MRWLDDVKKDLHIMRVTNLTSTLPLRKRPKDSNFHFALAIEDPFAKQWFATVYDTIGSYENFKTTFANLLWGQTRQAQIRCSIYQDRWDKRNNDTYTEHYIRYEGMASMLNPAMSEEDLVRAMINHFPPQTKRHDLR